MPRVLIPRARATPHDVQKDETLRGIFEAKCEPSGITWEEFVVYNFGAKDDRALNRALAERIGCHEIDPSDAGKSKLDPALKPPSGAFKLLLPKVWAPPELAPRQEHVFKIRRRLAPPAVAITQLDAWFLPKTETCRIAYALDGSKELADKASLSVYASNYCTATLGDDGALTFPTSADLASEVVWSKALDDQAAPRPEPYAVDAWKGESTAARGVLKARSGGRHINVACSPYTVVVRFYKDAADKDARLVLAPLWPSFDKRGAPRKSSLEISWSIEGTKRTLEHGLIVVEDKDGQVVLRRALAASEIAKGSYAWKPDPGVVKPDKLPYRLQVQVHTGEDEPNGLALAAMHTEVRLWVHPSVKNDRKDRLADPQCLDFQLAPYLPAGSSPTKGSELWYGLRLAELGYHPGPVDGDVGAAAFKMALKELQRSYPKNDKPPYQRLAVSGTRDSDTEALLDGKRVKARARFGEITNDTSQLPGDLADLSAAARLNDRDHAQGLILWVDDLHYYTRATIPAGCDTNIGLADYRGPMDQADDGKVTKDQESICRPWVPLVARPRVLSRDHGLDRATAPDWDDAMAGCIGPLRVDFAFTEAPVDVKPVEKMLERFGLRDPTNGKRVRTLSAVKHAIGEAALDDKGYWNCPKKYGGQRPDAESGLPTYYKELFGLGDQRLPPWRAVDDGLRRVVCATVHDDVGQDDKGLVAGSLGTAGLLFHPSNIAGDGYRLQAEVSFQPHPVSSHPNSAVLAARYPRRPIATSCTLRLWRRTALRGHVKWTRAKVDVATTAAQAFEHYRACHVHMTHATGAPLIRSATDKKLVDTSTSAFQDALVGSMAKAPYTDKTRLSFKPDYVWPWAGAAHFGVDEIPPADMTYGDYAEKFLKNIIDDTWDRFHGVMLGRLLDGVEKQLGVYRGHLAVGFSSSPSYWVQAYYCSQPARHRNLLIETKSAGDSAAGEDCRVTSCGGKLAAAYSTSYSCAVCGTQYPDLPHLLGDATPTCKTQCDGWMTPNVHSIRNGPVAVTYTCSKPACGRTELDPAAYYVNAPYLCGTYCGGNVNPTVLTPGRTQKDISGEKDSLLLSAFGWALGACFVFEGNNVLNWAHEMGHHRHLEHAAGAPGEKVAQHDSPNNPDLTGLVDAKDAEKRWDRCCIMGYVEKKFFCGKCVLKNRGWKVESLATLPESSNGP
jgi:hypothetical protein